MILNSRAALTQYALTRLGDPVIEINVTDEQLSDRLDEAMQVMMERHMAGSEKLILSYQIKASSLALSSGNGLALLACQKVTGAISGASANTVPYQTTASNLSVQAGKGTFVAGETITGTDNTGNVITGTVSTTVNPPYVIGDMDNGYITLPDTVLSVVRLLPVSSPGNGANNPFDIVYQWRMNDMYSLTNTSMIYYTQMQQQLSLLEQELVGEKPIRFNQHMHQLYITMDWRNYVQAGQWIAAECYRIIDPDAFTNVYNNLWLKAYFTALVKQQWASNMSKFSDQVLPGGVKLNAGQLSAEAAAEIEKCLDELSDKWTERATFFLG